MNNIDEIIAKYTEILNNKENERAIERSKQQSITNTWLFAIAFELAIIILLIMYIN